MADFGIFIIKPTIEVIDDILQMRNCVVGGIAGVPQTNMLHLNSGHIDLEFNGTVSEIPSSSLLEYLPELKLQTDKATYVIPSYSAFFEGNIIMDGRLAQHFDIRFH